MIISIIIPTYNRAHTLKRAIDSVMAQTFRDFELIVVDDASTDETQKLLAELVRTAGDVPFKVFTLPENSGVSVARNYGIEYSQGQWIAFLDSDDEWLPEKLAEQMKFVNEHPDVRLVHTEEIWIRDSVRVNPSNKYQKMGGRIFKRCVDLCSISPSTVLMSRDLLDDVGLFHEDFPVCEDYELWLRICAGEEVGFIDKPLIKKYGGHEDQLSKTVAMDLWRVRALMPFIDPKFSYSNDDEVRVLLSGLSNDFYSLISEDERLYARESIMSRLEILKKGALKHDNQELLRDIEQLFALC